MSAVINDVAQSHGQPLVSLRNLNKHKSIMATKDGVAVARVDDQSVPSTQSFRDVAEGLLTKLSRVQIPRASIWPA